MRLIVGLGNVGGAYERTRHNAGFMVIDTFLARSALNLDESKFNGAFVRTKHFIVAKPHTLMNASGAFVAQLMHFFKLSPQDVLVVYDDISHPLGTLAMKPKGSAGGHNGMADIIAKLGTSEIMRLKIGIGAPQHQLVDHVLSNFKPGELPLLTPVLTRAAEAIERFISDGPEKAMQ